MEILEAAMAFAVTMIIFSTLVTGIVELIHRTLRTRKRYLFRILEHLFDDIIWPRLRKSFATTSGAANNKEQLCSKFVCDMLVNPVGERFKFAYSDTHKGTHAYKSCVEDLSSLSFAERLGRSDAGKAMLAAGEKEIALMLTDFVRSFDRFGRAASEQLHQRSRLTAMIVGILLALFANIEAGRLMTELMKKPELRTQLVSQAKFALAENEAVRKKLGALLEASPKDLEKNTAEEIVKDIESHRQRLANIKGQGLPIGYDFYPYCRTGTVDQAGSRCDFELFELRFLKWLILCVLAGILAGLGGPFWFKVFTGLSQIVQVLRSLGVSTKSGGETSEAAVGKSPAEDSEKPESIADAFRVAALAHAESITPGARPILNTDGTAV